MLFHHGSLRESGFKGFQTLQLKICKMYKFLIAERRRTRVFSITCEAYMSEGSGGSASGIFCYGACRTMYNRAGRATKCEFDDVLDEVFEVDLVDVLDELDVLGEVDVSVEVDILDEVGVLDVANLLQFSKISE
ncbi:MULTISPECIES: hypothetical protein [unclassified Endozoicomonas]|uniref:hypothetical protein n=2 Tax=Endozoicomonas TaxID=305899 RepID=UPI003BB68BC1